MRESSNCTIESSAYSEPVVAALQFVEDCLIEGIKHGYFDCVVSCETGSHGRRLLIGKSGLSYKFTILENDVPV